MEEPFGPHLMLDLSDCDPFILQDVTKCLQFLIDVSDAIGMTRITQPYVFPYSGVNEEDWGVTGSVIIAESHISIHTFPFKKYAFVDIFSCKPFDMEKATHFTCKYFNCKNPDVHYASRGISFPR